MFEEVDQRCDGHCGLLHVVLTSDSVLHVSFLPKQLVDLFVKTLFKSRIPAFFQRCRERLTRLQVEELACLAEDDESVDEPVRESVDEFGDELAEEPVELQEEEQPEQDVHAADINVETCPCQSETSEQRFDGTSPS